MFTLCASSDFSILHWEVFSNVVWKPFMPDLEHCIVSTGQKKQCMAHVPIITYGKVGCSSNSRHCTQLLLVIGPWVYICLLLRTSLFLTYTIYLLSWFIVSWPPIQLQQSDEVKSRHPVSQQCTLELWLCNNDYRQLCHCIINLVPACVPDWLHFDKLLLSSCVRPVYHSQPTSLPPL